MLFIERVSPEMTILIIPNPLYLEVRTSGSSITWYRNGAPLQLSETINWDEIYYKQSTSIDDLGLYKVEVTRRTEVMSVEFKILQPGNDRSHKNREGG